ncbi:SDR family NAD(P)-dependent oxidoreductase [Actinokineospora auranticolor]|uniref:Polyketide synthase PksL n=1 Tax=Actinokineospora auranticolor TaxID=155976 RepID=A0A2S6GPG1_9PSEU|nr:SDR family NAD(P)-dependent oxidoreductase [Actinokineospora auranticolor]PPK67118.1 polyketide synthase PksL [Actinokineospora auranticolor]
MTDSLVFTESFEITADNPLLRGHVVFGRPLLPGVGYVDLLLQVLARHGHAMAHTSLRNLRILAPLVAETGELVLVTVAGRRTPAGDLRVEVGSRRERDSESVLHAVATAEVSPVPDYPERLALPLTGATGATTMTEIYGWCREHELLHSGIMKIGGTVHHRPGDWVAELALAPEFRDSTDRFLFHPALFEAGLLGGGIGIGMMHDGDDEGPGLFLPLVFESFRAIGSLGDRCYVRVPADSVHRDDELVRLRIEFYNAEGVRVAEVGQFVAKRIRMGSALDVRATAAPTAPTVAAAPVEGRDVAEVLRGLVAARLDTSVDVVDPEGGFYELGLTSANLLSLVADVEDTYSLSLSPTIMFEHRTIAELAAWLRTEHPSTTETATPAAPAAPAAPEPVGAPADRADVLGAIVDETAALLSVPASEVDPDEDLGEYGLDWSGAAHLADRLNERLGLAVAATAITDHRTAHAIAAHLTGTTPAPVAAAAHPLLHRRLPDDDRGARYESVFAGAEPVLADHRVRDDRVLPGVAHLELARAAAAEVFGGGVRLADVAWVRPATATPTGLKLVTAVHPTGEFTIHSVDADGGETLCCQGRAHLADDTHPSTPSIDELRAACSATTFAGTEVYARYDRLGLRYGPSQRSVVTVGVGTDRTGRPQVLAELRLPAAAEQSGYHSHPSVVDGALQATIGLWLPTERAGQEATSLGLPFAVRGVRAPAATTTTAYAWIRHGAGAGTATTSALDITILDATGTVCVDLEGLSTRVLRQEPPRAAADTPAPRAAEPAITRPGDPRDGDIAIVGVAGRYPEAADLEEFWQNLRAGRDSVREVPAGRWDHRRYPEAGRWGGFVDDIDLFDPLFFQISLLEAEHLDPQERLFLQTAHHTLEDAGYTGERLSAQGDVGVFVGVMYQEYQLYGAQAQALGQDVALWGSASTVANRVSYFYDFHGPSLAVDTMCSSSLTSIHLACEAIRTGQCAAAIAGGVNLTPHPNKHLVLSKRHFLSSDGRCRSFGEGGDGYVPGEGVGAVLLKPLARAVLDGDQIHGVIRGTAVNHGGRTTGYSVPTPVAQGAVVADAFAAAALDPRALSYLEAHGTGTSLGDPIEVTGLQKAFGTAGARPDECAIGSVKSNIGHLESAAGIAGVTKVLLQLRHRELVPSLHSETLNPHIDFDRTPLRVQRELGPWRRPTVDGRTAPRLAGVSSFGGGGSNAHVVIAEHEAAARPERRTDRPALLVLSAKSAPQLAELAGRLHGRLGELADADLADVAWTLQVGRMELEERLAFAASTVAEARGELARFAAGRPGSWRRGSVLSGRGAAPSVDAALAEWVERGVADPLLRLWVSGAAVDWDGVAEGPLRRVSLPGYPFARERCWLDLDLTIPAAPAPDRADHDLVLLRPTWTANPGTAAADVPADRHVIVVGTPTAEQRSALPGGAVVVEPSGATTDARYADVARQVFGLAKGLLERGSRQQGLVQVVLLGTDATLAGLSALLKTVALENPGLRTQLIDCERVDDLIRLSEDAATTDQEIRYRGGVRETAGLVEVSPVAAPSPWRRDGVYLITGGAGALGLVVARDIAAEAPGATVVLTGRSARADAAVAELRAAGLRVDYRGADITDPDAVRRLVRDVTAAYGPLTGVLHSAGVIQDNLILRKGTDEFDRVLAPKVAAAVLDRATADQPLELFACFSSIAGAFGNHGQADYAAGNGYLDAFAAQRTGRGRAVSIGWPLWDAGGMGDDTVRRQLRDLGLAPLDTTRGLAVLRQALAADLGGRLVALVGDRDALLSRLTTAPAVPGAVPVPAAGAESLADRAVSHLRRVLAAALKLRPERVDPDTALEKYGLDSVLAVNLITELEKSFGPLPRTLLFELPTIREVAGFLATDHAPALRDLLGVTATPVTTADTTPAPAPALAGSTQRPDGGTEIAIIGITGRYPGAADLDGFWEVLRSGTDCVTEVPAERAEQVGAGAIGAFLDGVAEFDPLFFGISPREASAMDPQQRLFLQVVWHLLEGSGVTREVIERRYGRRVGVYVGAAYQMYRADGAVDPVLAALTSSASFNLIANRVSHFFGLEGPSLAVDSMCASSTTAIHIACADLLSGESELAVAGGVNLTIHPDKHAALAEMRLLGTHAGSRSFRDGDGYLPAEAVGAVLLKPLAAALRDGDTVLAVIRGTASAHAGRGGAFLAPSHRTQVGVMRRALERAGVTADTIGYVEAAANGTPLSDEIELRALREVFAAGDPSAPVPVGTVKSNLGHPEAASGIAQLTKVVLQLRHGELAPLVGTGTPNPALDLDGAPVALCEEVTGWRSRGGAPRRALINSVAAGGSHVSLVVEAPPPIAVAAAARQAGGAHLVVVSALTAERLRTAARQLHDHLSTAGEVDLTDLAYTTQLGREALPRRLAVVAGSTRELVTALAHHLGLPSAAADGALPAPLFEGDAEDDIGPLASLLGGSRGEVFLAGLVADRDLEKLAELWVRGVRVPWAGLHDGHRELLPLPPTAFDNGRYWVDVVTHAPRADSRDDEATVLGRGAGESAEDVVRSAWVDLLQVDPALLGPTSDFFALGGNSLLATRLINLLGRRAGVELAVQQVFDAPRLVQQAALLDAATAERDAVGMDVDRILDGIELIERLSDDELDALGLTN